MKKNYIAPRISVIHLETEPIMLNASVVSGDSEFQFVKEDATTLDDIW